MTRRTWPSRQSRRAVRHAFWRHRRAIRVLLVGVSVFAVMQAVSTRSSGDRSHSAGSTPSGSLMVHGAATVPDGLVTTVIRLADPSSSLLVRSGSVVDILATATDPVAGSGLADVVASGVRVVRVPASDPMSSTADGAVLVVAATPETARALAAAASERLSVVVRSGATAP